MAFQKATKAQSKLRLVVFGPSGSGKTYTSLSIAKGLGGAAGLIDSEFGSASKYADRFDFVTSILPPNPTLDDYLREIRAASEAAFPVLIIDGMTHAWEAVCKEVEILAKAKYHGNTWGAWSEGTPRQKEFINSFLTYPGHVICTIRSKTEWTTEKDQGGKTRPVKIGLAPAQRQGIEYEFDMILEVNHAHFATVSKDRTGKYQDKEIDKPGEAFGKELLAWLNTGEDPVNRIIKRYAAGKVLEDLKNVNRQEKTLMLSFSKDEQTKIATAYNKRVAEVTKSENGTAGSEEPEREDKKTKGKKAAKGKSKKKMQAPVEPQNKKMSWKESNDVTTELIEWMGKAKTADDIMLVMNKYQEKKDRLQEVSAQIIEAACKTELERINEEAKQ